MSAKATRRRNYRVRLFAAQDQRCCYCGHLLYIFEMPEAKDGVRRLGTLEHLVRVADGGKTEAHNLALACQPCNSGRGEVNWVEFATIKQARAA